MNSELEHCRHQPIDAERWFSPPEPRVSRSVHWGKTRLNEIASLERMLHGYSWPQRSFDFKGFRRIEYRKAQPDPQIFFNVLAERWRNETAHLSSLTKKITHPSYLRIISLGRGALPLILRQLEHEPAYWFVALRALSGEDPVSADKVGNFKATREAWLRWGRSQGLV